MVDRTKLIPVYNRSTKGTVGYTIPELNNLRREFQPGETKRISVDELEKLSWIPGGMPMLKNFLIVQDKEVVEELIGEVEPEYYYGKDEILNILTKGSLDQLEDCLNFAPKGVLTLIKDLAIQIKLNDMSKREMILEKTGQNVDRAIKANQEIEEFEKREGIATEKKDEPKVRKSGAAAQEAPIENSAPKRKTAAPKYKVVTNIEE